MGGGVPGPPGPPLGYAHDYNAMKRATDNAKSNLQMLDPLYINNVFQRLLLLRLLLLRLRVLRFRFLLQFRRKRKLGLGWKHWGIVRGLGLWLPGYGVRTGRRNRKR